MGNTGDGIALNGALMSTIGGAMAGQGNIVSANTGNGISITRGSANVVQGNFIGTDASGANAPNGTGNGMDGIIVTRSGANTIGGDADAQGNVIAASGGNGVHLTGGLTKTNVVNRNAIGTDRAGTVKMGNKMDGVLVDGDASNNLIGGTKAGDGNKIANNGGFGVNIDIGDGNSIRRNSIFDNTQKGIRLNAARHANRDQAAPMGVKAISAMNATVVKGLLVSTNKADFTIEVFVNDAAKLDGKTFLGDVVAKATAVANQYSFEITLNANYKGKFITTTATDSLGDTSEFSTPAQVM